MLDLGTQPVTRDLLRTRDEIPYLHDMQLVFCNDCGFVQLAKAIPAEHLYSNYVCLSSWKPQPHVSRLLSIIGELPLSRQKTQILEVGSNDGSFLERLRGEGWKNVCGLEPARDACDAAEERGIETIQGYFNSSAARDYTAQYGKAGLLISRQVLEHVEDLEEFLKGIENSLAIGGYVVFEVPNFEFSMDWLDYGGIWEQHVNYFTLETIANYLAAAGVEILLTETFLFSGEALLVVGQCRGSNKCRPPETRASNRELRLSMERYGNRFIWMRKQFDRWFAELKGREGPVVLYGAGGRGCSLVNFMEVGRYIDYAVDDQSEKQGLFLPGSLLPIRSPDFSKEDKG
ncbi:MAG: class I SAM-dependent methyltransferase, partial [Candidatus Obscuribacterales bacterium]|nr:class I SAM-dependent methyltransferase [Candidatus Obscuribacterales bacterium]